MKPSEASGSPIAMLFVPAAVLLPSLGAPAWTGFVVAAALLACAFASAARTFGTLKASILFVGVAAAVGALLTTIRLVPAAPVWIAGSCLVLVLALAVASLWWVPGPSPKD